MAKILVAFYSTYGHVHTMAASVADGARAAGADVTLKRFPELIPDDKLKEMGAFEAQQAFRDVPELSPDDLGGYDGILFGFPTRYGNMTQQVAAILDRTGGLWMKGALVGKVGSVFTSTASQHGGQETTCFRVLHLHDPHGHAHQRRAVRGPEAAPARFGDGRQPVRRGHDRRRPGGAAADG